MSLGDIVERKEVRDMRRLKKGCAVIAVLALTMTLLSGCGDSGKSKEGKIEDNSATASDVEAEKEYTTIEAMIDEYAADVTLGDYKGIEYEDAGAKVTDDEVQAEVDKFVSENGTYDKDMDSAAKKGDTVNIDFVGTVDGEEFDGGNTNGNGYDLTLGSGKFIDGFEDQIEGHKPGETFVVKVTFPEDYGKEELNGKPAEFKTTLNYIRIDKPATYNDELVAANTEYKNTDEYEASIREQLQSEKDKNALASAQNEVMTKVIIESKIENLSTEEVQKNVNTFIKSVKTQAESYNINYTDYIYYYFGYDDEDSFNTAVYQMCEESLKERMVMCAIAKAEGMSVTDEETENYLKEYAAENDLDIESIKSTYSDIDIKYNALAQKVMDDVLMKNAKAVTSDVDTSAETSDADTDTASEE